MANQEATQIRKYVTSSDSTLNDSADLGTKQLQPALRAASGSPQNLDKYTLKRVADRSQLLYNQALGDEAVPSGFEGADNYLVSALGIRADATRSIAEAASKNPSNFKPTLTRAVESFRLSDGILLDHYAPTVADDLEKSNQGLDKDLLDEPAPFMNYGQLGFNVGPSQAVASSDPNALHGVQVDAASVAGQPLYDGGNVVLTGNDQPNFSVTVTNGGEVAETGVPVEVILNTKAERQSRTATIERIGANGGQATVEVSGFKPGEPNETAEVTVNVGPVKYEKYTANNTLTGTVTFGI